LEKSSGISNSSGPLRIRETSAGATDLEFPDWGRIIQRVTQVTSSGIKGHSVEKPFRRQCIRKQTDKKLKQLFETGHCRKTFYKFRNSIDGVTNFPARERNSSKSRGDRCVFLLDGPTSKLTGNRELMRCGLL